jgi:hypothetical protein
MGDPIGGTARNWLERWKKSQDGALVRKLGERMIQGGLLVVLAT